ncbi:MAG: M61 family peptidase [Cytophagales bacterium]
MENLQIYIHVPNPSSRMVHVRYNFVSTAPSTEISLPLWRPGRYENQNYAKNLFDLSVTNSQQQYLNIVKKSTNTWSFKSNPNENLNLSYTYYANQQDAGGSYVDDDVWYFNFVNFCMQIVGYVDPIELYISHDSAKTYSCGLDFKQQPKTISAICNSWYELYDSPFISSKNITRLSYEIEKTPFYLDFYGIDTLSNKDQIITDFKKFTLFQYQYFGEFPFQKYHFQFLILPYDYYHGVEHRNSTVIVLGSQEKFKSGSLYSDFLGISSHELFHAWNICKIRPSEFLPYSYMHRKIFNTGFVAEGFTTYLGDYVLYASGVISYEEYMHELHQILQRHFCNMANTKTSLIRSSEELGVDGYIPSHPERKVSIYDKGALAALVLDAFIEIFSEGKYSLHNVLTDLWKSKDIGYTEADINKLVVKYGGQAIIPIYEECIWGTTYLQNLIIQALNYRKWHIDINVYLQHPIHTQGYSFIEKNGRKIIEKVNPENKIYATLAIGDEIETVNGNVISIIRNGRKIL